MENIEGRSSTVNRRRSGICWGSRLNPDTHGPGWISNLHIFLSCRKYTSRHTETIEPEDCFSGPPGAARHLKLLVEFVYPI